jgi:hypothetical protein
MTDEQMTKVHSLHGAGMDLTLAFQVARGEVSPIDLWEERKRLEQKIGEVNRGIRDPSKRYEDGFGYRLVNDVLDWERRLHVVKQAFHILNDDIIDGHSSPA